MDWHIEVFDKARKRVAVLEKAFNINYTKQINKLSRAEFTLMINDGKNQYCKPLNYIKLYENGEYVDMFCIMPSKLKKTSKTREIIYYCEHVLGKLLNTPLFRYHEIGGLGTYTKDVINYLLSKQTDWKLGQCVFSRQFQYSWENENLLGALFSIPNLFDEEYMFTWDTTVYPWIINLVRPSTEVKSYLRYERNMEGITKNEDSNVICTRLYALGYGEGINQLGIDSINPTGLPYIEADTVNNYGVIAKIWTDLRYQIAENLYSAAKAKLEKIKQPSVTYEIDALELYSLTGIPIDKFDCGDVIRVIDEEIGIDVKTRIIKKSKNGIEKDWVTAFVEVAEHIVNGMDGLTDLAERAKINETYSQGATNINNYNYYGNCDTKYPAKIRFKIPEEAVHINKVELSFQADAFRAFSKAIKGGGSTIATTSSGGGTSSTTQSGGGTSSTTQSGGGSQSTTESGGGSQETTDWEGASYQTSGGGLWWPESNYTSAMVATTTEGSGDNRHNHLITLNHSHNVIISSHRHGVTIPIHKHDVIFPNHQHNFTLNPHYHSFTVEAHAHNITLNDHIHEIEYGIYEGPSASNFKVMVDGNLTSLTAIADGFDIVKHLKKTSSGKVVRGWHEVIIYPDNLCMINADVMVQVFVNSRGGGNY